jgi:hypothetical protein
MTVCGTISLTMQASGEGSYDSSVPRVKLNDDEIILERTGTHSDLSE